MKKQLLTIVASCTALFASAQTLDECRQAARANYPLIRQQGLVEQTTQLTLKTIQSDWLPRVQTTAQATLQSDVTAWPDEMQAMLSQQGVDVKGLRRDQYRVGVDVSQTLYDGGAIASRKDIARQQGLVEQAETDVSLYAVGQRVNELYFALLLLDERLRLQSDLEQLLRSSERKLESMARQGTAAQSDHLAVRAERLAAAQQLSDLQSRRRVLAQMLSAFCGIAVSSPAKPSPTPASLHGGSALAYGGPGEGTPAPVLRPELRLIDARLGLADARERSLRSALLPRVSVFAQGYYGYPGYNMFRDMLHRDWSLNGMVGARLTWNISALYTHRAERCRIEAQRDMLGVQRDVFLFNNGLETQQHDGHIDRCRQLLEADDEIVALRREVRVAAESKLAHGIIDVNDLLRELHQENAALAQRSTHEIELLKAIYDRKYTTGN